MNKNISQSPSCTIILAGGRGQRLGGVDKAVLINPQTRNPLIIDSISQLNGQDFVITRQKDQQDLSQYGRILYDKEPDQGPLSALVYAAIWAQSQDYQSIYVLAVDSPSPPQDWQKNLSAIASPHAIAQDPDGQYHPTLAFYNLSHFSKALSYYEQGGRRLMGWLDEGDFRRYQLLEPLKNINNFIDLTHTG